MISDFRHFHDGMRAAQRQGLRQECMLAPLLFNAFFMAVTNVAYKCFKADKSIMDALVNLEKKTGAGRRGKTTAGEPFLVMSLWGMLYADDAGVIRNRPRN